MKAMLFAAGLGTRLQPLTNDKPKALVELNGKTMLEHNIVALKEAGVESIVINIHHFGNQIVEFIKSNNSFGINIQISDESEQLLDTGGGLKKATSFFNNSDTIILQNADIISSIDYIKMIADHKQNNAIATLAVRKRSTSRYLLANESNRLIGWKNTKTDEIKWVKSENKHSVMFGFSGIHIISPEIFNLFPDSDTFNIIQWYLKVATEENVYTFDHSNDYWFDIGTLDKLKAAEKYLNTKSTN